MSDPNLTPNPSPNPDFPVSQEAQTPLETPAPSVFAAPIVAPEIAPQNLSAAAHISSSPPFIEPIAPEPIHAGSATNPLLAMLAGAVLACVLLGSGILIGRAGSPNNGVMTASPLGNGVSAQSGNAIVRAVAMVGPAVMNVDTTFGKPEASDFLPTPGQGQNAPRAGKGTGFVIDSKNGYMLTNAHVVAGAQKIQVTTRDGEQYTGIVTGFDRRTDIAVVQLSNRKLPQAKLATFKNAKELPIGDWAIAIGNPFAQENTVTVGVLSAVGRTLPVPESGRGEAFQLTDMMQTDAAINPGNSGGPLCNLNGEVIGINTAIIPFGQGLGFSIPINKAKFVADQIIKNGKVLHPYIGVAVVPITDAIKSDYGLPDKLGALVQGVEPNSPAAKSGLQQGDVIRKLNDQSMKSNSDVVKTIGDKKVGDVLKIEILRNNSVKKTLTLKVGDRPN
ncbi:serine protease Do [Abditibacterium utsteinense]|uniref:Serine protease Do n=1 Tax=Abditibacterium utsteinense TaxID=1960156 RepID=A0A2S8SWR5_9BACT|nr:trypsin-like peptidase domain-containing protein [Abditibacterium utsteinense]PQV65240.1 serine protease Do [Abditibacterium utsteinense]